MSSRSEKVSPAVVSNLQVRLWSTTRSLAARLIGDPYDAEQIVKRAFLELRGMKADDVGDSEKAEGVLADIVVRLCLEATGCSSCAADEEDVRARAYDRDEDVGDEEEQDECEADQNDADEPSYALDDGSLDESDEAPSAANDNGKREDVA